MRIENIIEAFNRYVEKKRKENNILASGHLVLQRVIIPHSTFKAYKYYKAILWFVKDSNKYEVIRVEHTAMPSEDIMEKYINVELCYSLFNLIETETCNKIIDGTYNEDSI